MTKSWVLNTLLKHYYDPRMIVFGPKEIILTHSWSQNLKCENYRKYTCDVCGINLWINNDYVIDLFKIEKKIHVAIGYLWTEDYKAHTCNEAIMIKALE